ncbi:Neuropeptide Y receptor [Folsomia candida]|uniref:Neuropeptide Y receptor n=1 Tax=Folsomia candida TaxID=158441 RepID=A0A226DGG5_FOLCA|nr:Neuropeptide Y receptor [Folsomia candida]
MLTNLTSYVNATSGAGAASESKWFKIIGTSLFATCIFINVAIVAVIGRVYRKRKIRDVTILIGNLCMVVIYLAVLSILSIFQLDKKFAMEYLCNTLYIQRAMVLNVLPLTILSISYERMRKLKPSFPKVKIAKMLLAIWSVAVLAALPALWTMEYDPEKAICVKMSSTVHRMIYHIVRCVVFHFVVAGLLVFELYKVRSKFKYFYKIKVIHSDKIRRKVQRVRFLYCNSIIFICFWVPLGISNILYEVIRKPDTSLHKEYPVAMYIVSILFFAYVMCLPFILLCTSDLLKSKDRSSRTKVREEIEMTVINSDFSRCSTHGVSHIPNITVTTESGVTTNELIQSDNQLVTKKVEVAEVYV